MPAGPRPYTLYTAIPRDLAMPLAHASDTGNTVIAEPARVVFPDAGFTRADVAGYYRRVAPQLLADIAGRPLSLLRCPDGLAGECFFQRHPEPGWDATVHRFEPASENGRPATCVYIDDVRGLLELVRLGVLELHVWGSTARMPDRPERAVFDLDPGEGVAWTQVVGAAREIRAALARRGLRSFARLTGGKGVHVVLPFAPGPDWATVKAFSQSLARQLAAAHPERYVASASKHLREGRIFIDWLRNVRGASSIANWSLRARPGAPVAMPLHWRELGVTRSGADYPLPRALRRIDRLRRSPWEGWTDASRQRLPPACAAPQAD